MCPVDQNGWRMGAIWEREERKLKEEDEGASGEVAGTRSGRMLMFQLN